jgi:hypothetical protein
MTAKITRLYESGVVNMFRVMGMEFVAGFYRILLASWYPVQG